MVVEEAMATSAASCTHSGARLSHDAACARGGADQYVLEGEIWFFVEERGFQCKAGDFHRIPAHKIHWAWNRSNADAVVVEAHAPALVAGKLQQTSIGLFDDGEKPADETAERK